MELAILIMAHLSFLLAICMIVVVARKCQSSQIRTAFLVVLGVMLIWDAGTILEMDFRLLSGISYTLFIDICYIGICLTPIAILMLGMVILQPEWQIRPKHALFLIVPLLSIGMVFTNSLHKLFFVNFSLYSSEAVYGGYYYFHSVYSYGCIVTGIVLMIIASSRGFGIFSKQSLLAILGVFITLVPNILYSFGVGNLPFSISNVAFNISLLCFAVAFLKYQFVTTLPITLRQIVDLISDGYLVVDKQERILDYNRTLSNMFPPHVVINLGDHIRPFIECLFTDASYERFLELKAEAIESQKTILAEKRIMDGAYVSVEITPIIRRNAHIGSIILLKDITESKQLIEATQAASQAKGEFLSHMSHEIRTPLNAIIGMINIGTGTADAAKKDYCLKRADTASKHLLGIINDILDMSKIEANKFELSYSEFDLEQSLKNITNMANIRAEEKQQDLIVNLRDDVPDFIWSDELRLSQVITNLLTNAIKFTPEKGTIKLNIEMIEIIDDNVVLRIEVADTGIGISKEQQERLFTSFNQADAGITQKYGGTGLGLAISKRIVELMGGEIWIESDLGKGSKFTFTMKAKKIEGRSRQRLLDNVDRRNLHILAIDDAEETREYFMHVMEALKLSCDVAAGGTEALDMVKAEDKAQSPYNIFFVDWQMPEMDGIELTRKIKEIAGENSIVIMISANNWSAIEKEAVEAGVNHFISKPLFPSTLINAINICAGAGINEFVAGPSREAPGRRYDFYDYTILIAEDVDINREILSAILEETNISIDYAENGRIAVSMFSENPERYSLILMDINMPEMNGYEATRHIRSLNLAESADIPILAMTANVFKEDIERCLASGMNDHTGKPIDTEALLGLLNKYLLSPGKRRTMKNVHELEAGIAWDEDLITGNALVDMQHQRLYERVSELVRACEDGSDIDKLEDTLEFLVNHTIRHFADEEALQIECAYPGYERHKKLHDEFRLNVSELMQRFRDEGPSAELSADVSRILVRWLVNHNQNEDRKISEHIRAISNAEYITQNNKDK